MFLKKVLNQPNVVGTLMIALLFGVGFVYAFAFDGFNVQTVTDAEVEAWISASASGGSSGDDGDDVICDCLFKPGQPIDRSCGQCATDYECKGPQTDCDTNCIKGTNADKCSCETGEKCKVSLCKGKSCVSE